MENTDFLSILDAREARWKRRQELCRVGSLLTLTLNLPGPDKAILRWLNAYRNAVVFLNEKFLPSFVLHFEQRFTPAGPEAHWCTAMKAKDLKRFAVDLEETHPIGRLLDADVLDSDGTPVGRTDLDLPLRRCLCCEKPAKICAPERRHSLEEIMKCAEEILDRAIH